MARGTEERRRAERYGRSAESLAVLWLVCRGYRILARRCRMPSGEIDIVACRGRVVVACEVKARRREAEPPVSPRQWRRIADALDAWLAHRPALSGCDRRFDLIEIGGGRLPRHRRDVWRP